MSFLGALQKIVIGAPLGVLAVVALPVFGAVGTITAAGIAVGSVLGATGGVIDELNDE
jgi:hypothetical protein